MHADFTLYYVHDPMCSWCWGFVPVWQQIQRELPDKVEVRYLLGGLAADTDRPMPVTMQMAIKDTWHRIQREIPGTEFNYDFWSICTPRRSTYQSCRSVVAAAMQDEDRSKVMLSAIQKAYYLRAKNPSDTDVLISLASEIGLDKVRFEIDLASDECAQIFNQQRQRSIDLGVSSYPALVLERKGGHLDIPIDYIDSSKVCSHIMAEI